MERPASETIVLNAMQLEQNPLPQGNAPLNSQNDSTMISELSADEESRSERAVALPPIDGGKHAWSFVFCASVVDMLIWGFPYSYGVFQEYYLTHRPFENTSEQAINSVGNIAVGIMFGEIPFVVMFMRRYPHWIRTLSWICLVLACASLFLSSFATKVWHLIVLQGFVVGVTGGIVWTPIVVYVNEWFLRKRGLASSIIYGGAGLGGVIFPLLIQFLLTRTGGFRWTLRILAIIIFVLAGAALAGVRPRVPVAPRSRGGVALVGGSIPDYGFLKNPLFIVMTLTVVAQSLAFYPVSIYIPSYSSAVGLSTVDGTVALVCFNIARTIGQVGIGELCDRLMYTHLIIISGLLSAASTFLMWGFAHNLSSIFAFVVCFGLIAGGFGSLPTPASTDLSSSDPAQTGLVFGFLNVSRGGAAIIGPIIAAALHQKGRQQTQSLSQPQAPGSHGAKFGGYGFTLIEIFVGSMMMLTALGGFGVMFLRRGRSNYMVGRARS